MECKLCKGKLGGQNKSGYCTKCYKKSSQYLEYQRIKQSEFYYKYKDRKQAYYRRPDIKRKTKAYQKKYQKENIVRLREIKNKWARKPENREKKRRYLKEYRKRKMIEQQKLN